MPDEDFNPRMNYNGHVITVNKAFHFTVEGPEFGDVYPRNPIFDTVVAAKNAIDKKMELKAKTKALKYARIALNPKGELVTITGFTRSDGEYKAAGDVEVGRAVYPNVAWIKNKLEEFQYLEMQYKEMGSLLGKYEIRSAGRTYRGMSPDDYARKLSGFDKELDEAEGKAIEDTPMMKLEIA